MIMVMVLSLVRSLARLIVSMDKGRWCVLLVMVMGGDERREKRFHSTTEKTTPNRTTSDKVLNNV